MRSTRLWQSQLLAEETTRLGTSAPRALANMPAKPLPSGDHGRVRESFGDSCSPGR